MTDTSIRAELSRAALAANPWKATSVAGVSVAYAFCRPFESFYDATTDQKRWFCLLVAEAL